MARLRFLFYLTLWN